MATESVQTTFEEASRCPKCKQPGKDVKTIRLPNNTKIPRGSTVHTIRCENCDFGVWLVQVNADGSVPPPRASRSSTWASRDTTSRHVTSCARYAQVFSKRSTAPSKRAATRSASGEDPSDG
jgi:hypothetical protein